ncbi:hypothetical protein OSB04_021123 [Centaurea solstitialis]|uniref:Uncharacterized protein n=1 Tax=Centaurea solstitialis TaxID=347529 RepID=A0AA38STL8_9ASTR|nr:hypothetical protein OSB04_021123 [Centaurea solstitialis]
MHSLHSTFCTESPLFAKLSRGHVHLQTTLKLQTVQTIGFVASLPNIAYIGIGEELAIRERREMNELRAVRELCEGSTIDVGEGKMGMGVRPQGGQHSIVAPVHSRRHDTLERWPAYEMGRLNRSQIKDNLVKKGVALDTELCPLCNAQPESLNHLFVDCRKGTEVRSVVNAWWTVLSANTNFHDTIRADERDTRGRQGVHILLLTIFSPRRFIGSGIGVLLVVMSTGSIGVLSHFDIFVNGVGQEITRYHKFYYRCSKSCGYSIHKYCGELPPTLEHPSHNTHPLILTEKGWHEWWCDICRNQHEPQEIRYRCSPCDYDVDINCVMVANEVIIHL